MKVDSVLTTTGDNTPPILCPVNGAFEVIVSGMSGTDSMLVQKSSDNGATWTLHTTISADGTARAVADVSLAVGIRVIADVIGAGHSWTVSVENIADATGLPTLTLQTFDYIYDYAIHGGTNNSNFTLTPSKPMPANTICVGVFAEILTTLTGGGGFNLGVGLTANLDCLSNAVAGDGVFDTAGEVHNDMFPNGTREIFVDHDGGGPVDVKGQITGNSITAGKVRITLWCLSYGQ